MFLDAVSSNLNLRNKHPANRVLSISEASRIFPREQILPPYSVSIPFPFSPFHSFATTSPFLLHSFPLFYPFSVPGFAAEPPAVDGGPVFLFGLVQFGSERAPLLHLRERRPQWLVHNDIFFSSAVSTESCPCSFLK